MNQSDDRYISPSDNKAPVRKIFEGRPLVIATKHQKEKVIAPLLEEALGVKCFTPDNFDSDLLGTFTGEIERKDDPVTTMRNKCLMAMEACRCELGVASEGSFGPHPHLYFLNADDELIMLIDRKNNLEIMARELSTETNFYGSEIKSEKELKDFARQVLFPSHAIILRNEKNSNQKIIKGIHDWTSLMAAYNELSRNYGSVYAETDMRAMHNPSRMKVIEKAVANLTNKIFSVCPVCHTPGFDVAKVIRGLPCGWCGNPTDSVLSHLLICHACGHQEERKFPLEKKVEDPMYCSHCNP